MLLGGLWHGAGWTYVVWGGLHGFYLVVNHFWRSAGIDLPKTPLFKSLSWVLTFISVVIGWVFFRAASISDAFIILQAMAGRNGLILPTSVTDILIIPGVSYGRLLGLQGGLIEIMLIFVLVVFVVILPNVQEIALNIKPKWATASAVGLLFTYCFMNLSHVTEFLYFQF